MPRTSRGLFCGAHALPQATDGTDDDGDGKQHRGRGSANSANSANCNCELRDQAVAPKRTGSTMARLSREVHQPPQIAGKQA
jgi:hypothetical protein